MKIAVYAIAKNEETYVKRFLESAQKADSIYIFDTGSKDSTVSLAKEHGAIVSSIGISPWRFDDARNAALSLLPMDIDICVSIDLDEILEQNWRDVISDKWNGNVNRLKYLYDWGKDTTFFADKIHSRTGFRWKYPCHEVLVCDPRCNENKAFTSQLLISHIPDDGKSRSQYLDLLKVGTDENLHDSRSSFYYGRELFFRSEHDKAIVELERYINLPSSKWNAEKSYAMRMIAKCYSQSANHQMEMNWSVKAINLSPERRENWYCLARAFYNQQRWQECYEASIKAINITEYKNEWPHEPEAWGCLAFDFAAISAYWLNKKEEAFSYGNLAVQMNPDDARLKNNLEWYIK